MAANSRPDRRRRVARGIYQQPNGKYAVCVRVDGRARFRTLQAATLVEAVRQRELLQGAGRLGDLPLSPRLTFAEVASRWLAEFEVKVEAGERRERTLELYRSQLRRRLLPRLGRRRLVLVTVDDVVAIMRELRVEGLSPWTIKRILGALSCVLTFALRRGYISAHPFDRLERDERPHPLRSDQRVLTRTELGRLFAACPRRYRPLLLTGAYTGMRLSEVLGLSWDDVDFAAGVVHVRHQLARGRRGVPPHRIPPKTRASVREIPLLPQLAAILRQHRHSSRLTRGCDYVFATGNGTPFLHHNVSKRVLRRAATSAGLDRPGRRVRFHDLRHTFASHLIIDIRLDVAQVSRILGHARTSMTLDTYTHLFEEARHGADVRAELAKSDFANPLSVAVGPPLQVREHLRLTRAAAPRRLPNTAVNRRRCAPHGPTERRCCVTKTRLTVFVNSTGNTYGGLAGKIMGGTGLEPVTPSLSTAPSFTRSRAGYFVFASLQGLHPSYVSSVGGRLHRLLWAGGSTW
jgi:integrase